MKKQTIKYLGLGTCLVTLPGVSLASGFALTEQSASGLGNAYAGQAASAQDASTVFFNPAGMTLIPGKQLVLAGSLIDLSARFSNSGSTAAPLQALGDSGGDAGSLAFVPSFYYVQPIDPSISVGLGVNVPFGLKTEYDQAWIGRFLAVTSQVQAINVNPSVAYKVNDVVSLGLGASVQRADATLSNMVNYSAAAGGLLGPDLAGLATVKANNYGWGYNGGALFNLGDTRIGVAYRSKISYKLDGNVSFSNVPGPLAAVPQLQNGPITADLTVPATASLSVVQKLAPTLDLLADATWTGWSCFNILTVSTPAGAVVSSTTENSNDTMRYSLGLTYTPDTTYAWRAGIAYDQTPVPALYVTPRLPDADRTWLALGGQYRMDRQNAIDFGYAHVFFRNLNTTNSVNNANALAGTGTLVGSYSDHVDILSAQYTHTF
ncbi:MAG: OmpP1/FadL family transporter [Thiobacillaceae bacterium]